MLKAYPATLIDGQLHWTDGAPAELSQQPVNVEVTFKTTARLTDEERRERLTSLFERVCATGGITSIEDPAAWQREQRQDRPLFGRE